VGRPLTADNYHGRPFTPAEIAKRYRKKHPARAREQERRWHKTERGMQRNREGGQRYRVRHWDRVSKYRLSWQKVNPDITRAANHLRRARRKGNGGSFTLAEWLALKAKYGFRCLACGKTEKQLKRLRRTLSPDHVIPLAPPFNGRNDIGNIQPLCHSRKPGSRGGCNNRKHARHIDYRSSHK